MHRLWALLAAGGVVASSLAEPAPWRQLGGDEGDTPGGGGDGDEGEGSQYGRRRMPGGSYGDEGEAPQPNDHRHTPRRGLFLLSGAS